MVTPFAFSFLRELADGVLTLMSFPIYHVRRCYKFPLLQNHPLTIRNFGLLGHGPFPGSAFALVLIPSLHSFPENALLFPAQWNIPPVFTEYIRAGLIWAQNQ